MTALAERVGFWFLHFSAFAVLSSRPCRFRIFVRSGTPPLLGRSGLLSAFPLDWGFSRRRLAGPFCISRPS